MPLWLLWLLPAYEAGVWTTLFGFSRRQRAHTAATLLYGDRARTSLPIIDKQLLKAAGSSTKSQAAAARWTAGAIRSVVNTKAFDNAVLLGVKARWPKQKTVICSKVKLCL